MGDPRTRRAYRAARIAHLSEAEHELLEALRRAEGQPVAREALAGRGTRALDMLVHRVRTEVERDPSEPAHLLTVHGVGYRWVDG